MKVENFEMFYFAMTEDLTYQDSKYTFGLNVDPNYKPKDYTCRKGLFFCREEDIPNFLDNSSKLAFISIPDDAKTFFAGSRNQADKIVITKIIDLKDWEMWDNKDFCIKAVQLRPKIARYIKNPEILFAIITWNPRALQFIENQTEAMCLEAVSREPYTLRFVKNRTDKICLEAFKREPLTLRFIENQNERMCLEAVERNGYALQYVKNPTIYMCLVAKNQNDWISLYALNLMEDINNRYKLMNRSNSRV